MNAENPAAAAPTALRVLLVDDDEDDYLIAADLLDELDAYEVALEWADSADAARAKLSDAVFDLCLLDYRLGPVDGLTLLAELPRLGFKGPVIMLTGQDDRALDARALQAGAADYLVKTRLDAAQLERAIRYALTRAQIDAERMERLRAEARQREAEAESRAKNAFIARVSHELRTPMAAVLGYAELLAAGLDDPEQIDYARTIQRNGRHLLDLLNDVLDLSKIEAGKLEIDLQPVSPAALIAEVRALMAVQAEDKRLAFDVAFDGPVPATIRTDPTRLRQILINLLGNAIKFTAAGGVTLRVGLLEDGAAPRLRCVISDTGPGIAEDQLEQLFEPFVQLHVDAASGPGSGLGLAISRQLAGQLGGELRVSSRPGHGSTFTLIIATGPLDDVTRVDAPLPAPKPKTAPELRGRVLVVDDQADLRRLLAHTLRAAGADVDVAADGVEALARIDATDVDLVVLDMQMPRLNGYDTVRRLRVGGFDRPVVALTAAAMRGERERCLAAGCSAYLSKPVSGATLVDAVARLLARGLTAGGAGDDAARGTPILIVDDSDDARNATARLLRLSGYRVDGAANGADALERAAALSPRAILLDINLPDTDGYALATRLRRLPACAGATIIALTGAAPDPAVGGVFDHHVLKPATREQLTALLPPV